MADPSQLNDQELARQAQAHLDSLRASGVEWLPFATLSGPPPVVSAASAGETQPSPVAAAVHSKDSPMEPDLFAPHGTPAQAAPENSLSLDERRQALQVLAEKVSTCPRCPELAATRTQTVFGAGQPGAELCFVGEAPGADEDAQGEPFVGAAGQLLNRIIAACHLKREEVYICNIIKCRPPGNRTPLPNEVANCREYLDQQLALVRPKFICALGSCAAQNLLGTSQSLGRLRGRFHDYKGIPVLVTYHPAYLLPHRSPEKKKDVWIDMKMLMARMGRPVE